MFFFWFFFLGFWSFILIGVPIGILLLLHKPWVKRRRARRLAEYNAMMRAKREAYLARPTALD